MNRKSIVAAFLAVSGAVHAALQPGDLAFTAFNADEDGFALVALRNVAPFTTVHFSDNEWSGGAPGTGSFNTGENTFAWVTGSNTLQAGSVVRFRAIDQATRSASAGAFGLVVSGTPGFSATGDTMFAYTADASGAPTGFIAAMSSENFAGSSLAGTGLATGVSAVAITPSTDFGQYTGIRSGLATFPAYAGLINDATKWTTFTTGDFPSTAPDMTTFSIAAVPEPQTYALLLTGLGLIAMRLRQRQRMGAPMRLQPAGI